MSDEKYIISIGCSRPKDWKPLAEAIMLAEGTNFSHVFVSWKCTNIGRRKVYEAVGSGSRKISNERFKEKAHVVEIYQFEVSLEDLFKVDRFTHDQAGTPYGYKHLVGLTLMRIKGFLYRIMGLSRKAHNPFKDGDYSQICVEAGALVIQLAKNLKLPGNIEDYGLKEFYEFAKKHGKKVPQEKIDRINKVKK
jgi:hypothetical protein